MIKVDYSENEIKVFSENVNDLFSKNKLPLTIHFTNHVTKKTIWSTEFNNHSWVSFPNSEMIDVIIKDSDNKIIFNQNWNVVSNGSYHYKTFYLYCKNLERTPRGIAIGTHNGEFGEWVPLVLENKIESVLVEASEKQFEELFNNFKSKTNTTLLNCLITTDGKDVEFFEGGRGYTNSIVERVIRNWEIEEINSTLRKSISINDLIKQYYPNGFDWLHLDVEGLDSKLIMSIEENLLPNLIIFEDDNLLENEKNEIYRWLSERKYVNFSHKGNCTSIRS
jgi:hypothetical protein